MDIDDNAHRLEMKKWIRSQFEMAVNKQDTNDEVFDLLYAYYKEFPPYI